MKYHNVFRRNLIHEPTRRYTVAEQTVRSVRTDLPQKIRRMDKPGHFRSEFDTVSKQSVFESGDPQTHGIVHGFITEQQSAASFPDQLFGQFCRRGITVAGDNARIQIFKIQQKQNQRRPFQIELFHQFPVGALPVPIENNARTRAECLIQSTSFIRKLIPFVKKNFQ